MIKTPSSIVLGGAGIFKKGMTQLGGTINLNLVIKQLFANSEQGFTQTLDDYSILFQDAVGTTPVTAVGKTLGLVLDKSKGVTYSENLSSTNKQQALNSQAALNAGWWDITRTTSSFPGITQTGLETNSLYKVKVSWQGSTGGATRIEFNSASGNIFVTVYSQNGTWEGYVNSLDKTQLNVYLRDVASTGYCGSIKIESIRKVSGNHSYQTTSSMRPLLQDTPRRIQYDGIDDKLTTTLPAQLTGCTVIRAIPNVGCQIITGQPIGPIYEDSINHCGLIVINRALTAYETSLVTKIFNKLAGV